MEGLVSMGPTPSSFYRVPKHGDSNIVVCINIHVSLLWDTKWRICWLTMMMKIMTVMMIDGDVYKENTKNLFFFLTKQMIIEEEKNL